LRDDNIAIELLELLFWSCRKDPTGGATWVRRDTVSERVQPRRDSALPRKLETHRTQTDARIGEGMQFLTSRPTTTSEEKWKSTLEDHDIDLARKLAAEISKRKKDETIQRILEANSKSFEEQMIFFFSCH
jgi:hypothetical protein